MTRLTCRYASTVGPLPLGPSPCDKDPKAKDLLPSGSCSALTEPASTEVYCLPLLATRCKAICTRHTPNSFPKRNIPAWSSRFYSPVLIFPHLSSSKSRTPYQLPPVGPMCHPHPVIYPIGAPSTSTLSLSSPPPTPAPPLLPVAPCGGARRCG
jgi:hypothetical protein